MTTVEQRIAIPGTQNLRDIGGYRTGDGRRVRNGLVLRAETLADPGASEVCAIWDAAHGDQYDALGLATVIDLRSDVERGATPSVWARATGAAYYSIPIAEGAEGSDTDIMGQLRSGRLQRFEAADLAEHYVGSLRRRATSYGRAVSVLAGADRLPVLVHCAAGKDRTGLLIALILDALGVDAPTIVGDYTLTGVLRPNRVNSYAEVLSAAGVDPQAVRTLFETPAEAMDRALCHLAECHGDAAQYLIDAGGVAPADLERLRSALLTDAL